MAGPGAVVFFNTFGLYLADGTIDLDTDTIKLALCTSSFSPNAETMSVLANITNEVANGNGYTTGGVTLTTQTWTRAVKVSTFDADDSSWTASVASWNARYGVLYANVTRNTRVNPLIGYFLLDSAPADVTFSVAVPTTIKWHTSGIFTITLP